MGGHMTWFANDSSQCGGVDVRDVYTDSYLTDLGVTISGATADQRVQALVSAILAGTKLSGQFGGSIVNAYKKWVGPTTINITGDDIPNTGNCETVGGTITCHHAPNLANTLHEMAHVLDNHVGGHAHDLDPYYDSEGNAVDGGDSWTRGSEGFLCVNNSSCMEHRPGMGYSDPACQGEGAQSSGCAKIEQWGDLFMNWVLDGAGDPNHGFANNAAGDARRTYMLQQFNWLIQQGYLP